MFIGDATTVGQDLNTALNTNVTGSSIISEFINLLPWIGAMVGVAFLIYEARKMIKGASKAKVRV